MNKWDSNEVKVKDKMNTILTSHETWMNFFNLFTKAIIITDLDLNILSHNKQAIEVYRKLGWEEKPENIQDFFNSVTDEMIADLIGKLQKDGFISDKWSVKGFGQHSNQFEINGILDESSNKIIFIFTPLIKESSKRLVRQDNLYVDIINNLKCYIVIHTKEGVMVDVNKAFCELIGISKSKALGENIFQYIAGTDKENFQRVINHLPSKKSTFNLFSIFDICSFFILTQRR